ncbi:hypothetical protein DY000_02061211 [Brassica cretica]|uniref:Uncharacterized protein n=1 Tax=Brassica cretica TaxID=69181 RepID=A0ABQ7AQH9_BRACR|nr:hypothetical protein DY000_02061211 [Brassica cretica]
MDQRAKSIQLCKDQISILERKSSVSSSSTDLNDPNVIFLLRTEASCFSCCREKTDGRCGDQFLQLGRVESDSLSKAKPKVPGKTGSLLDEVKTAIGTSTPYVRVYVDNKRVSIDGPIGTSTDTPLPTSTNSQLRTSIDGF